MTDRQLNVKLPEELVIELRCHALRVKRNISDVVGEMLRSALNEAREKSQKEESDGTGP
jgi:metal-responsive CopG/Arc/MetJ family transcriptional regulator